MGNYVEFLNHITIMKKNYQMQDFWLYIAKIQDEVTKEVLKQVTVDEYHTCLKIINDYMFCLKATHFDRIWAMNRHANKFIDLINEALKKRSIMICEYYVHISSLQYKDHGKEN